MKKIILLLVLLPCLVWGQSLEKEYQNAINNFIKLTKTGNKEELAKKVVLPLRRGYPIPWVQTKEEFIKRYQEIFDENLVKLITASKLSDWSQMGDEGLMLKTGDVWLDYDGHLIAVNYQSAFENNKQRELIEKERSALHPSLRVYKSPTYILETKTLRIRIDELNDGTYRYASWAIDSAMSTEPYLVITNGELTFDGSGGNHHIDFKMGPYTYECYIFEMGEEDGPPATVTIYKDENEKASQAARIVGR